MKICFAAVAASTLLVFAAAEERHNLRQVKGGVLAELAEADTDLEVYSDSEAYSDSESYYSYGELCRTGGRSDFAQICRRCAM